MEYYKTLSDFYNGKDWAACKAQVLQERLKNGEVRCEHCGEVITKNFNPQANNNKHAMVFHHKIELNIINVNDASISINPDNIAILHWACHNEVHKRFCAGAANNAQTRPTKKVYLITGPSCSGKTTFVKERASENDIVVDIDDIWQFVTRGPRYFKPTWAKPFVFAIRDRMLGLIQDTKLNGVWQNAFVIESLPFARDRQARASQLQAEIITMDTTEEECLTRLRENPAGRDIELYQGFIRDYFRRFI